jgi:hypothetical protein
MPPFGKPFSTATAALSSALAVVALFAVLGAAGAAVPSASMGSHSVALIASNSTSWAYGGTASGSFACSSSSCLGFNLSSNTTSFNLSWKYYLEWVVLYNATNVSTTQRSILTEAAINVSASYAFSECTVLAPSTPCSTTSVAVDLAGRAIAHGATNLTNGTVNVTSGPDSPGTLAALAVTNASAAESANISGSLTLHSSNITGVGTFVVGGSARSSVAFGTPLGIVPYAPHPGDAWTSSAAYSASGNFVRGYSYTLSASGYPPVSRSNWTHLAVAPSGTLTVDGVDLGAATLWDNFTSPHGSVATDRIHLDFPDDPIAGTDGWMFAPAGLSGGLASGLGGGANASANNSSEDLYFAPGQGFVGERLSGNTSNVSLAPGGPNVTVTAGPEPFGVAQAQYAAITANPPAAGFPIVLLAVLGGIAVVAGVGFVMARRHAARRPPAPPQPSVAGGSASPSVPSEAAPPTPPMPPAAP